MNSQNTRHISPRLLGTAGFSAFAIGTTVGMMASQTQHPTLIAASTAIFPALYFGLTEAGRFILNKTTMGESNAPFGGVSGLLGTRKECGLEAATFGTLATGLAIALANINS